MTLANSFEMAINISHEALDLIRPWACCMVTQHFSNRLASSVT